MATSSGERPALIDAVKRIGLVSYNANNIDSENTFVKYIKIDKCVAFFAQITATETLPEKTVNGLFPNMPTTNVWTTFPAFNGISGSVVGYLQLRTDGGMRNYATINGTAICYGVYFTD